MNYLLICDLCYSWDIKLLHSFHVIGLCLLQLWNRIFTKNLMWRLFCCFFTHAFLYPAILSAFFFIFVTYMYISPFCYFSNIGISLQGIRDPKYVGEMFNLCTYFTLHICENCFWVKFKGYLNDHQTGTLNIFIGVWELASKTKVLFPLAIPLNLTLWCKFAQKLVFHSLTKN